MADQTDDRNSGTGAGPWGPFTLQNFKKEYNAAAERGAILDTSLKPEGDRYWTNPQRVVRYKTFLDSQAPDWQPPDWMNRENINAAYDYLKFRNNDKPWREWQPLPDDDPGMSFLQGMARPPAQDQPTWDSVWEPPAAQNKPPEPDAFASWDKLNPWQQLTLGLLDPQPGLPGRPEWTRYTAALGQGVLAVPGGAAVGAAVGSAVPILGTSIGALVGGGIALGGTAYQTLTGNEVPVLSGALNLFNIPAQGLMRLAGLGTMVADQGWEPVVSRLPAAWQASELTYRTLNQDLLNAIAVASGDQPAGPGEVWQIQKGFSEPQKLRGSATVPGYGVTRGPSALAEATDRINKGESAVLVYQDFIDRFGFSGTFNDFIIQTVADPLNLAPYVGGKVGQGVSKLLGNERLAAAFEQVTGNPVADTIPFVGVPIAKLLFGKEAHASGGVIDALSQYGDWVRRGVGPDGQTPAPATELSRFDRIVAGVNKEGRIRSLEPTPPTGNKVKDWFTYLRELTPDAKAYAFLSLFHDNVSVGLDMAKKDPAKMIEYLDQAASASPAAVGQLGEALFNSPSTATIAQALRDTLGEGWHKELLLRYEAAQPKRKLLEKIARAVGQTPGEVLERAAANPAEVITAIQQAGGPAVDIPTLKTITDVFTGPNALPLSAHQFQAQLALTVFDKLDGWLVKRYGIKPDAAVFRLSRTLKGMQSLLLLGFNPSYFVNNAVNNVVTKTATGIWGYLTPRQVESFLDRFGITPQRLSDALPADGQPRAGAAIDNARRGKDWIGKASQVINATNNKLGVFSRFSSAHEGLESRSIYTIAMQKYWGKAWKRGKGFRRMHPTVEAHLDAHYPGVKDLIYSAIEAGMNMQEIEARIYGEAMQPQIGGIIDQVAREMFPDSPDLGVEMLKAHGITDALESYLASGDEPARAFERVREDLNRITNEQHKRDVAARPDDIANKVKAEGTPAILEAMLQVNTRAEKRATGDPQAFTRLDEYARATWGGILKSIPADSPVAKDVIEQRNRWNRYARDRRDAAKRYNDSLKRKKGESFNAYEARKAGAKAEYDARLAELYRDYRADAQRVQESVQSRADAQGARAGANANAQAGVQPGAAPDPRITALEELARRYNLTDSEGRPVLRYLLNIYNRSVPEGERITRAADLDLEKATQAMEAHARKYATDAATRRQSLIDQVNEIIQEADDTAREADLLAHGLTTRRLVREQLGEVFHADDSQVDAAIALMDAHADLLARRAGLTPTAATRDGWYASRIARAISGSSPADVYNNMYQEQYGSLFAMHNVSEQKLIEADRLGAMPAPSIAVVKKGVPLQDFGEISLIGTRRLVDPQVTRENRVFSDDISSPVRPLQVWEKIPSRKAQPFTDRFWPAQEETGDYFTSQLWDLMVNTPDRNKAVELFENHAAPMRVYLQEQGITPPAPVMETVRLRHAWTDNPDFVAWVRANLLELESIDYNQRATHPLYLQFQDKARQAVLAAYKNTGNDNMGNWFYKQLLDKQTGAIPFNTFDSIITDVNNVGRSQINRNETLAVHKKALREAGLEKQYLAWTIEQLDGMYKPPKLKLGGKLVDYTLPNIVDAMTRKPVRAGDERMVFGIGEVKATAAREFQNVDQIHKAENRLVDAATHEAAKTERDARLQEYRDLLLSEATRDRHNYSTDTWDMLDDSMRALAYYLKDGRKRDREKMRTSLRRAGFMDVPDNVITAAISAAESVANTPTEYFEAKPQRPVYFDEFAGAVIPKSASPQVREVLERRGIEYREYDDTGLAANSNRERAIAEFYNGENVLFQSARVAKNHVDSVLAAGFVPAAAVRQFFMDVADPQKGPAYIRGLVRYIVDKRAKYDRGEMTVRDVAKAYLATVSSQGSAEREWSTVKRAAESAGLKLVRDGQPIDPMLFANYIDYDQAGGKKTKLMIRPEEFAGLWMWTDEGRATLDKLERGEIDVEAWKKYIKARSSFGRYGRGILYEKVWKYDPVKKKSVLVDRVDYTPTGKFYTRGKNKGKEKMIETKYPLEYDGQWFIERPATKEEGPKKNLQDLVEITKLINDAKGNQAKIEEAISQLAGVSEGKTYFVGHMLGFGQGTVIDTQQANFWKARAAEMTNPDGSPAYTPAQLESFDWGNWGKIVPEIRRAVENVYWDLRNEHKIGSDIPEDVFVYSMHHWLWSVAKGALGDDGPEHQGLYMALELAQGEKAGVHFLADGRAVLRGLNSPNVSSLVHEVSHVFRRDLEGADLEAVAQLGGMSGAQLTDLQGRFDRGEILPGDPEYQRLIDAEETFARGWERYLAEGDAPTPELRGVFQKFTDWMIRIYQGLRARLGKVSAVRDITGFERLPEFSVGGKTVSLTQTITRADGTTTTLRDVFDRLLTEQRQGGEDLDPYAPSGEPPAPAPTGPAADILNQPVRKLPEPVRLAMQAVATHILNDLEGSQSLLLKSVTEEGGAEVTKYRQDWEGPYWYRQILDQAKAAGRSTDSIKDDYRQRLQAVISGGDTGKAAFAPEVKQLIVDFATGADPNNAYMQPVILRYLGMNDQLFSLYGDQILSSEQPALERMFGSEWSQVVDDALMWMSEHDQGGEVNPVTTDIEGNPPAPIQPDQAPEPTGPVNLFGEPVDQFQLAQQSAPDEQFNPQQTGQQDALFNRREYLPQIEAKDASASRPPEATDNQNTLFQSSDQPQADGNVPPGGTPTPEPWGAVMDESLVEQILPLLNQVEQRYNESAKQRPVKVGELDGKAQGDLRDYLNQVQGDMASTKYGALGYGERMRDTALLNYSRRYGLDNIMDMFVPYQFWYTRSMIEWAKRMVDRPAWFGLYARLLETQEEMAANMPARLRGKMRMPAPWLPDWAGGGLYFDPLGKFLPFSTFGQPTARWQENVSQVQARAEQVLGEMVKNDTITQAEADQAIESHSGSAWSRAMAAAQAEENGGAKPENLLGMMMTPALWWTAGANLLNGTPQKISTLPITRTAGAIESATRGSVLEPIGKLAGLAAWPERQLRKAAGLSEFGEWGDYYIDRQLANMAADGAISAQAAQIAMIERRGPAYDQARERVALEQAYTVPGAAALQQLSQGNLISTLQALPTLIFGGTLLPDGELKLRNLKDDFGRAYDQFKRGDKEALDKFFKQYPEYEARLALYDKPEERLKQFLISEVWDRYTQLEKPNRAIAIDSMGPKFEQAFLNKETRSYDSIKPEELARWSQMLGGALPDTPETRGVIESPEPPPDFYPPQLAAKIEAYQKERSSKFPNYYAIQSAYFSIPETDKKGRRAFIKRFPQLPEYWDWKKAQEQNNPDMAPYFERGRQQANSGAATTLRATGSRLSERELAQIDGVLLRQVLTWKLTGQQLTTGAYQELSRLGKARKVDDPEQYAQLILASVMGQ